MFFRKLALVGIATLSLCAGSATAATIGALVDKDGNSLTSFAPTSAEDQAGVATIAAEAGASVNDAIGYFIPLADVGGSANRCAYGSRSYTFTKGNGQTGSAICGQQRDYGSGGSTLAMFLNFGNVEGGNSILNLYFEDLDLLGLNDPDNFSETVSVFHLATGGMVSLGTFVDDSDPRVSGDKGTQLVLRIDLGNLVAGSEVRIRLDFTANYNQNAWNSPEYMIATISAVPVPAAGLMLLGALGGLAAFRRRRSAAA